MREQIDTSHESLEDGFEVAAECIITGITVAQMAKLVTEGQAKFFLPPKNSKKPYF